MSDEKDGDPDITKLLIDELRSWDMDPGNPDPGERFVFTRRRSEDGDEGAFALATFGDGEALIVSYDAGGELSSMVLTKDMIAEIRRIVS